MQILEQVYVELAFVQKGIPETWNSIMCHHATQKRKNKGWASRIVVEGWR